MSMFSTPHGVGRPNHNAHNTRIVTMMLTHPQPPPLELDLLTYHPLCHHELKNRITVTSLGSLVRSTS